MNEQWTIYAWMNTYKTATVTGNDANRSIEGTIDLFGHTKSNDMFSTFIYEKYVFFMLKNSQHCKPYLNYFSILDGFTNHSS